LEALPTPYPHGQQRIDWLRNLATRYELCSECLHQCLEIFK